MQNRFKISKFTTDDKTFISVPVKYVFWKIFDKGTEWPVTIKKVTKVCGASGL